MFQFFGMTKEEAKVSSFWNFDLVLTDVIVVRCGFCENDHQG